MRRSAKVVIVLASLFISLTADAKFPIYSTLGIDIGYARNITYVDKTFVQASNGIVAGLKGTICNVVYGFSLYCDIDGRKPDFYGYNKLNTVTGTARIGYEIYGFSIGIVLGGYQRAERLVDVQECVRYHPNYRYLNSQYGYYGPYRPYNVYPYDAGGYYETYYVNVYEYSSGFIGGLFVSYRFVPDKLINPYIYIESNIVQPIMVTIGCSFNFCSMAR